MKYLKTKWFDLYIPFLGAESEEDAMLSPAEDSVTSPKGKKKKKKTGN